MGAASSFLHYGFARLQLRKAAFMGFGRAKFAESGTTIRQTGCQVRAIRRQERRQAETVQINHQSFCVKSYRIMVHAYMCTVAESFERYNCICNKAAAHGLFAISTELYMPYSNSISTQLMEVSKQPLTCMLRHASISSDGRVVGSNPHHGMDKSAGEIQSTNYLR